MRRVLPIILLTFFTALANAEAEPVRTYVPMHNKGTDTLYVRGSISGIGEMEFMVDTGASYLALNEEAMRILSKSGHARFVKQLSGLMADGRKREVPVYVISELSIGDRCIIRDVEAAVLPGNTRNILGLSALRKTAPFMFSMDPPSLGLSQCASGSV
jgi:clan AA aspartic protease (TIGR02281 family)